MSEETFNTIFDFVAQPLEPRLCKFCGLVSADYTPLEQMENFGAKIFFCHRCNAEYIYYSSHNIPTQPASISLYLTVNKKMYRWTAFDEGHRAVLWWVKDPGKPGLYPNKDLIYVLGFTENVPQITPDNITTKILIWLPFI